MGVEKRREIRRIVRNRARIMHPDGSFAGTCLITEISGRGARLVVPTLETLPDQFILVLSHTGQFHRRCSVIWRSEDTVGVQFRLGVAADRQRVSGPS
jgi:hypothetical protein